MLLWRQVMNSWRLPSPSWPVRSPRRCDTAGCWSRLTIPGDLRKHVPRNTDLFKKMTRYSMYSILQMMIVISLRLPEPGSKTECC